MRKICSPKIITMFCVMMAFILIMGCATFKNLTGKPQLQVYTFNYEDNEYSAVLPKGVPIPSENPRFDPVCPWFWRGICVMHINYMAGEKPWPRYPVASFWFTHKLGVVAFVWHTLNPDGSKKHEPYLYAREVPVSTDMQTFNSFLNEELPLK